jgi:hypothetical protein
MTLLDRVAEVSPVPHARAARTLPPSPGQATPGLSPFWPGVAPQTSPPLFNSQPTRRAAGIAGPGCGHRGNVMALSHSPRPSRRARSRPARIESKVTGAHLLAAQTDELTAMGWQLVREAEDHSPDELTWRERFALGVLANAAMDDTRICPDGIEDRPEIIRRLRIKGRSDRYEVIKALCDKGALIRVERGRNGVAAVYAIAVMAPAVALKGPPNPDPRTVDNPVDNWAEGSGIPGPSTCGLGSGNPGFKGPPNPDPSAADTVFFRGDRDETIPHARARDAIRAADPAVTETEIDQTISLIKTRYNPRNIGRYIQRMAIRGDLAAHIPCGLGDKRHSDSCRSRNCRACTYAWCEGRCHARDGQSARTA